MGRRMRVRQQLCLVRLGPAGALPKCMQNEPIQYVH